MLLRNLRQPIAAGLLACLTLAPSLAEEKPKCLPAPTLACVTQVAAASLEQAVNDEAVLPLIDMEDIARVARAHAKLADKAGLERTLALLRTKAAEAVRATVQRPENLDLQVALVMASVGRKQEARAGILKHIRKTSIPGHTMDERWVKALLDIGLVGEARSLLARHREGFQRERASISPKNRVTYLLALVKAHHDLGDEPALTPVVRWLIDEMLDLPIEKSTGRGDGGDNIVLAQEIASVLLVRGHAQLARPFLGIANEHIARTPAPGQKLAMADRDFAAHILARRRRIEYRHAFLAKEDDLVRISRRMFAEGRDDFETRNPLFAVNLHADMLAAAMLKDIETITVIADRATANLDHLAKYDESAYFLAMALAIAGREDAVAKLLEPSKLGTIGANRVDRVCSAFARVGHVEPALRCAARLNSLTPRPEQGLLTVYGLIAEALLKQ